MRDHFLSFAICSWAVVILLASCSGNKVWEQPDVLYSNSSLTVNGVERQADRGTIHRRSLPDHQNRPRRRSQDHPRVRQYYTSFQPRCFASSLAKSTSLEGTENPILPLIPYLGLSGSMSIAGSWAGKGC